MPTTTSAVRRVVAIAGAATIMCVTAITTTYAASPTATVTETVTETETERPCFIVQPRWNDAIGGPAPTCPVPLWKSASPAGDDTRHRLHFGDEHAADPGY